MCPDIVQQPIQKKSTAADSELPPLRCIYRRRHCAAHGRSQQYAAQSQRPGASAGAAVLLDRARWKRALAAADSALSGWATGRIRQQKNERRILDAIAEQLDDPEIRERIARADAITTGAVINVTRKMAQAGPFVFRHAAQYIREGNLQHKLPGKLGEVEYFRRPWGPALLVSPWNGPTAIGSHKIASALAAGAPCIAKPSEWAPHSALIMAEIIQTLNLPRGTFQLTCGSRHIGGQMVSDPRIKSISFTGGTAGGRVIASDCAEDFKPTQLGTWAVTTRWWYSQMPTWIRRTGHHLWADQPERPVVPRSGRIVVHSSVKEALLERVRAQLEGIILGHSLDEASDMGPLIHQQQYDSVLGDIDSLAAKGGQPDTHLPRCPIFPGISSRPR